MTLMVIALAAYAAYVINAGQFVWKLRAARLQAEGMLHERSVRPASGPWVPLSAGSETTRPAGSLLWL